MTTLSDIAAIVAQRRSATVDVPRLIDDLDARFGPLLPSGRTNAGLHIVVILLAMLTLCEVKNDSDLDKLDAKQLGQILGLAKAVEVTYKQPWGDRFGSEREWLSAALAWIREADELCQDGRRPL